MATDTIISTSCLALSLVVSLPGRRSLAGTTLLAAWGWTLFSLSMLLAIELGLVAAGAGAAAEEGLRYIAATTTFCPLMAVLGAKRPQHVGWQLIVVTLWVVLALPAVESLVLWRGGRLDVGAMRAWLLLIFLLVGLGNYLFTRFWLAVLLVSSGQALLLREQLPTENLMIAGPPVVGVALLTLGIAAARWFPQFSHDGQSLDPVWIAFRDGYGTIWGLRVMERANAAARFRGAKVCLRWQGLASRDATGAVDSTDAAELDRAVVGLLRRFVSPEWIAARRKRKTM